MPDACLEGNPLVPLMPRYLIFPYRAGCVLPLVLWQRMLPQIVAKLTNRAYSHNRYAGVRPKPYRPCPAIGPYQILLLAPAALGPRLG